MITKKALLEKIFSSITSKISELDYSQVKNYARAMSGIDLSFQIEKWISENHLTQQSYTNEQLIKMLIDFFLETHTIKKKRISSQIFAKCGLMAVHLLK